MDKQNENYYKDERDNIDFDTVSAYIDNSLSNDEIAKIEKMFIENDELAETVYATCEFLEDENQNKGTIIPMKKSRRWNTELLRYAAAIFVIATAVTFVTIFIIPQHDRIAVAKSNVYRPKRTRSITQPTSVEHSSIQKTNEMKKVKRKSEK